MSIRFLSTALVLIATANPALARITPDDAWNIWMAQAQALSLTTTATPHREGDRLIVDRARFVATLPGSDAKVFIDLGRISFAPDGRGGVDIGLPATGEIAMGGTGTGTDAELRVRYSLDGFAANMTGDPGNVTTSWRYDGLEATLGDLLVDGKATDGFSGTLAAAPFTGTVTTMVDNRQVRITAHSSHVGMEYGYVIAPANAPGNTSSASGSISDYVGDVSLDLPRAGLDLTSLPAQLRDGLALVISFAVGDTQTSQKVVVDGTAEMDQSSSIQDQTVTVGLSENGLRYEVTSGPMSVVSNTAFLPVPVTVNLRGTGASMKMPLLTAIDPQPAQFTLSLEEVTVNDALLDMVDPEGRLPRDPAFLNIDITGTVKPLVDLLDFPTLNKQIRKGGEPVQVHSVTANNIFISAVGVTAEASGAFTLNNADRETFDGLPAPVGEIEARIEGANTLIDTLIEMGLIANKDATGIRVMLGMFGQVGDGEDTVTSTIEVRPDGSVFANGQRMK